MANVCRTTVIITAISFAAFSANAQLINPGFETPGATYILPADNNGNIVTNTFAAGWTPTSPTALVTRDLNIGPTNGVWEESDFGYDFNGVNQSANAITARSGTAALRTWGPFGVNPDGVGAFQIVTNNFSGQAVSNGQIWAVTGYGLNWSGDKIDNSQQVGALSFGVLQVGFYDISNNLIGTAFNSNEITTNTPLDQWTSCTVTATAPAGTFGVGAIAIHVGNNGALGSVFWDDIVLTNTGIAPPPPPIITNQFQAAIQAGNQICWASVATSSYQPQSSDDNVNWTNVGTPIPGDGATNCAFAATHKFYRVVQSQGGASVLTNPGFETGTASNEDSNALGWTQFNDAFRTSTNIPGGDPSGSGFGLSAHSGAFSMKTFGPFGTNADASGAYQGSSASSGQAWRFTGWVLNGVNDQLAGPDGYGVAQLIFLDNTGGTGNVLQATSTLHYGTDLPVPLNVWQKFEVDAVAPAGVATVRGQVAHVGNVNDSGSMWWDDVTMYQVTGSNVNSVVTQAAVQVSWPTSTPSNAVRYQIQSTPTLVFTNLPALNALTNAGFEADAVSNAADTASVTGWNLANGGSKATSSAPKPTHSGIGALRMLDTTTAVPVAWEGSPTSINIIPATPGQVWDETGFGYVWTSDQPLNPACNNGGLLKIVWLDSAGNTLQPLGSDTNLIGTAVTGQFAGIESAHIIGTSPQNTWIPMEARSTAPPNTAYVQAFCILVGNNGGGVVRFDDIVMTSGATHNGWQNFGPIFPGTGNTNSIFDTIGANSTKFYRVTTP